MSRQGKLDGFGTRAGNQRSAVRTPGRRGAGAGLLAEHAAAWEMSRSGTLGSAVCREELLCVEYAKGRVHKGRCPGGCALPSRGAGRTGLGRKRPGGGRSCGLARRAR